jgi:hypothetical protein
MHLWRYVARDEQKNKKTYHHVEVVANKLKEASDTAIRPDSVRAV